MLTISVVESVKLTGEVKTLYRLSLSTSQTAIATVIATTQQIIYKVSSRNCQSSDGVHFIFQKSLRTKCKYFYTSPLSRIEWQGDNRRVSVSYWGTPHTVCAGPLSGQRRPSATSPVCSPVAAPSISGGWQSLKQRISPCGHSPSARCGSQGQMFCSISCNNFLCFDSVCWSPPPHTRSHHL